jgi:hypothetical protein
MCSARRVEKGDDQRASEKEDIQDMFHQTFADPQRPCMRNSVGGLLGMVSKKPPPINGLADLLIDFGSRFTLVVCKLKPLK